MFFSDKRKVKVAFTKGYVERNSMRYGVPFIFHSSNKTYRTVKAPNRYSRFAVLHWAIEN